MTPPKVDHGEQLKKLTKDLAPKLKSCGQLKQKLGKAIDFDAKGLKKMEKNEKKLKQACEKYGLATGELPAMHAALTKLLALASENPNDPAFVAAIAASSAAAQAKTPEKVFQANSAKLAGLEGEIDALNGAIAKCRA